MSSPFIQRAALLCVVGLPLAGCSDDPDPAVLGIEVVDHQLSRAVPDTVSSFRVSVRGPEGEAVEETRELRDGRGSLDIPFDPAVGPLRARVELLDGSGQVVMHGASPPFFASETGGLVRILASPPGVCDVLDGVALPTAVSDVATSEWSSFALIAGGAHGDAAASSASFFDGLRLSVGELEPPSLAVGRARSAPLGEGRILVVGDRGSYIYDLADPEARVHPVTLHPGAGSRAALVTLPEGGALVVGGSDEAVARATWVDRDGAASGITLASARRRPGATPLRDGVLVVGGAAEAPAGEWISLSDGASTALPMLDGLPLLEGATLIASPNGDRALLLGGTDLVSGEVPADTWILRGCPEACAFESGLPLDRAESGMSWSVRPGYGFVVGPSGWAAEVSLSEGAPQIDPLDWRSSPRADAGVLAAELGPLLVVGGTVDGAPSAEIAACSPRVLPGWP